ncbi:MAG: hypothetical protein M3373_01850 [Gemmatimonadota bacterium]|nr:hypothetical protein [Gemmatimonadota bacterium]
MALAAIRYVVLTLVLGAVLAGPAPLGRPLGAQVVDPGGRWRTLRTAHFDVHFAAALEEPARRAAAAAEGAYVRLAAHLVVPRARVQLVVSDDVDFTNGFATPAPWNRIVVYLNPPLNVPSLRFYDDWLALVITHELTHIFHLDRATGIWGAGQRVFGRLPWLFPNLYAPAWIAEGLATYYESAITGSGRLHGSHERMLIEASALANDVPRLNELSLATSRYPGGESAYAYGALFFGYLADTRGPERVADYVERSSRSLNPFRLNSLARRSFGISFERAWRQWQDSLRVSTSGRPAAPLAGWRDLTREGRIAQYPRWASDTTLVFSAATGKDVPRAYRLTIGERGARREGRRNGVDANAPRPDGSVVFAQLELVDAYHVRSDLYLERDGRQQRLTRGARLVGPDARADGWVIAVRLVPATNQLVRVSPDGALILAVTQASPDTQWAEPRWSPRGDRIAVTRWTRGGYADIVVLDTLGRVVAQVTHDRAVDSSPSWMPDGSAVVFTSDRAGIADVYLASLDGVADGGPIPARRISRAATGLFYPAVSPDGERIAAALVRSDGWHIGVAPLDVSAPAAGPAAGATEEFAVIAATRDTGRVRGYSPWALLVPRYWLPLFGQTAAGRTSFGAQLEGADVINRHAYTAQALLDPRHHEHEWFGSYRYRGLRQPVMDFAVEQGWTRTGVHESDGQPIGVLRRRERTAAISLTVERPRARTGAYATLGGELEQRRLDTEPASLIQRFDPPLEQRPEFRALVVGAGWSNTRRPALSISPEDGISLAATSRWRWLRDADGVRSRSTTAVSSVYKSIDAGGFAHQVLAARVALGYADGTAPSEFSVGGTSGSAVILLPGLSIGERRSFGVRGFPPGARSGRRAVTGSLEYRAPLAQLVRGVGGLPVFLDRASIALFGDAGTADERRLRATIPADEWLVSAGAELNLDAALQYDVLYRIRFGLAAPVMDNSFLPARGVSLYVRFGSSF